jgi:cell division protein FtsW
MQPDFGSGVVMVCGALVMIIVSPFPVKYFIGLGILGVLGLVAMIASAPYRLERILSFINPFLDPLGSGFQAIQSLYALAPSGLFGLGYNKSIQKHFFLPEPQNDFIFAIVAEELGLIGASFLLILFLLLIFRIFKIGLLSNNSFKKYLAFGIALIFFVQVFINIGVVIGLLPVTGITLPIISYGGTSIIISLAMIGVVLNISKDMGD